MDYSVQTALRKSKRVGYLRGRASVLLPRNHEAAVALARRALNLLPDRDRFALVCEKAIDSGEDAMLRAVSILLGATVVIARRFPVLQRALVAEQIFKAGRELMGTYTPNLDDDDGVKRETLH
jgi:hypothetical protein